MLQYVKEAEWHDQSIVVEGKNTAELSPRLSLESMLTYSRYEIKPDSRYVFPVSDTELFFDDYKYGLGTGVALEEKGVYEWNEDFTLISGIKAADYDIIPKATVPGGADTDGNIVSQAGSFTYYTIAGDPSSRVDVARATDLNYQDYGTYLEGHYQLAEQWSTVAGARLDWSSRYDETPFSPRLALIFNDEPTKLTVKYIFTKAFVAPAPYFGYNVFDNGVALNTVNADLRPEEAVSNELNAAIRLDEWLFGLSAYYSEQDNLIAVGDLAIPGVNVIDDEVYLDEDGQVHRILTQSANGGNSTSKGFEFYTRYQQRPFSLWGSYSFVDFSAEMGGVTTGLAQISKHNIRLGGTCWLLDGLSFTPSLVYRSTPENMTNEDGLEDEAEDPYEINAHVLYEISKNLDVFITIRNLTNHHYALKGVLGPMPQETFQAKAGLQLRF